MRHNSLDLIYEDNDILVCIKPSGIATQSKSIKNSDMESAVKNHIAKNSAAAGRFAEPYLAVIHRLDQPVQGIMVFAKTIPAARALNKEMQEGGFGKHYRALVSAPPPESFGVLENYILEDRKINMSRICQKDTARAKFASLSYRTVPKEQYYFSSFQNNRMETSFTELDIHLHTGRHHQIRIQLAYIGCPIIGDTKYNPGSSAGSGWQELKLCSYCLEFTHPKTKKRMRFSLI